MNPQVKQEGSNPIPCALLGVLTPVRHVIICSLADSQLLSRNETANRIIATELAVDLIYHTDNLEGNR